MEVHTWKYWGFLSYPAQLWSAFENKTYLSTHRVLLSCWWSRWSTISLSCQWDQNFCWASHRIVSVGRDLWSRNVSRWVWNVSREGDSPPDLGQILKISWGQAAGKVAMGMCEALSSLEMGFCSFLPLDNSKQQSPPSSAALVCLGAVWSTPSCYGKKDSPSVCCWDALPAAFCLLSDPSRPGFVLVVPLLLGLGWAAPASSLWDYAPQFKAGLFLVLGSVRAFLRTWNFHRQEGWRCQFCFGPKETLGF